MIEWWRILLWSLPAFFALGAVFFLLVVLREGGRCALWVWRGWAFAAWRRFWRARPARVLMRFEAFRRWVP